MVANRSRGPAGPGGGSGSSRSGRQAETRPGARGCPSRPRRRYWIARCQPLAPARLLRRRPPGSAIPLRSSRRPRQGTKVPWPLALPRRTRRRRFPPGGSTHLCRQCRDRACHRDHGRAGGGQIDAHRSPDRGGRCGRPAGGGARSRPFIPVLGRRHPRGPDPDARTHPRRPRLHPLYGDAGPPGRTGAGRAGSHPGPGRGGATDRARRDGRRRAGGGRSGRSRRHHPRGGHAGLGRRRPGQQGRSSRSGRHLRGEQGRPGWGGPDRPGSGQHA